MALQTEKALANPDFPLTANLRKARRLGSGLGIHTQEAVCTQTCLETKSLDFQQGPETIKVKIAEYSGQ